MFNIYILYSQKLDKFYVGSSGNIELRVTRHNAGLSKFSSRGIPWELVYFEEFNSKLEPLRRERGIKSKKSRMYIEKLISGAGGRPEWNSGSLVGPAYVPFEWNFGG